MELIRNYLSL